PQLKISIKKPDIAAALQALKQVLGVVSLVKDIQQIDAPGGIPSFNIEVEVAVPIFDGLSAGAVVEARNGTNLRFAGPVSITLPTPWITLSWVALGRIRTRVDLNKLNDIALGASLTLAPGEGTYETVGMDGDLRIAPDRVELNSIL